MSVKELIKNNPSIQAFIKSNPTKEEYGKMICDVANENFLEIDETYAWDAYSNLAGLTKEDFVDDLNETVKLHGQEALNIYGLKNWKLKQ